MLDLPGQVFPSRTKEPNRVGPDPIPALIVFPDSLQSETQTGHLHAGAIVSTQAVLNALNDQPEWQRDISFVGRAQCLIIAFAVLAPDDHDRVSSPDQREIENGPGRATITIAERMMAISVSLSVSLFPSIAALS